jgi:hypothetical protein
MLWLNWVVTRVAAAVAVAVATDQTAGHAIAAAAELVRVGRQHLFQMSLQHATQALLLAVLHQVLQETIKAQCQL